MAGLQATRPFRPQQTGGTSLALTSSGTSVAIPGSSPTEVRLNTIASDAYCFLAFGSSTTAASLTTSMAFPPGNTEIFRVPIGTTYLAGITASGTATVYIHSGEGA